MTLTPVHLGRTGLRVSPLCLGTMNFGPQTSEQDSHAILDAAREAGDGEVARAAERAMTPVKRRPRVRRWLFQKAGWVGRKVLGR